MLRKTDKLLFVSDPRVKIDLETRIGQYAERFFNRVGIPATTCFCHPDDIQAGVKRVGEIEIKPTCPYPNHWYMS